MTQTDDKSSCPQLERGQIIPAFSLPGTDGMPHSPWDYKQREHLLLIFCDGTTQQGHTLLQTCAQHYRALRKENCALLAITAHPVITNVQLSEELHLPFPLLADVNQRTIQRYTYCDAHSSQFKTCIVLADRYNALYECWIESNEKDLPTSTEILASLQYMNNQCSL
jgi:peroxiredoxin